jgi:hypothetical protein
MTCTRDRILKDTDDVKEARPIRPDVLPHLCEHPIPLPTERGEISVEMKEVGGKKRDECFVLARRK